MASALLVLLVAVWLVGHVGAIAAWAAGLVKGG